MPLYQGTTLILPLLLGIANTPGMVLHNNSSSSGMQAQVSLLGAPESASAASQAPDFVITSNFSESYEHFAGLKVLIQ